MNDPLQNFSYTASMLSTTALNKPPIIPTRYGNWKIARNCAIGLGAIGLAGAAVVWVGQENDRRKRDQGGIEL